MSPRRPLRRQLRGGSTPRVTPLTIFGSSLELWLRADMGVTLVSGDCSAWADQSGKGDTNRDVVQTTASRRPTWDSSSASLNGAASMVGAATKGFASGMWSASLSAPYFVAWSGIAGGTAEELIFQGISTNVFAEAHHAAPSHCSVFAGAALDATTTDLSAAHVGAFEVNGASSKVYVSSTTAAATGNAGTNALGDMFVMNVSNGGALPWLGELHELIVVSGTPTASQRSSLMAYMGRRIGINVS